MDENIINIINSTSNQNPPNINPDLYFKAKLESEVIKVPQCTFANDVKTVTTFYFCSCSKEDFFPICEACARTCHKDHNPSLNIHGIYTCKCGENNHEITQANEATFNQRKQSSINKCFYPKFMNITPSKGFYKYKSKTYCAVCVEYCRKPIPKKEVDLLGINDDINNNNILSSNEVDDFEFARNEDLIKLDINIPNNITIHQCYCNKHFEHNVVNLNLDLSSKPKFHTQLQNFNFNILSKICITEEKYLNYLITKIKDYASIYVTNDIEQTIAASKDFFSHFINYKILECFSMFAQRWENKFFHVKNYFDGINPEILIRLMSISENAADINEAIRGDFFSAKFYFAELVFNYLIRTYLLKYNNLWNIRTIINMNLYQRKVYLHEIKTFFKFHSNEQNAYHEGLVTYMIDSLLELYDNILKFNDSDSDSSNLQGVLFSYIFPTFTRIFKYLMKYNLLNHQQSSKYFELVFDSLKTWNEMIKKREVANVEDENKANDELNDINNNKDNNNNDNTINNNKNTNSNNNIDKNNKDNINSDNKDNVVNSTDDEEEDADIKKKIIETEEDENNSIKSAFYIMKSILYTLIYTNDEICLNYLRNNVDKSNNKFVFIKKPNIEKICKVFMSIINTYYRKEDLNRTIIYDFYVRKILELLIGGGKFYISSIENLSLIDDYQVWLFTSDDFNQSVRPFINKSYLESINKFNYKLGLLNRQYFEYGINLESYIEKTNEIMGEFKSFITQDIGFIPNLQTKYSHFIEIQNDKKYKKVKQLQNAVKYTIFFQKIEEYIHICAEGKTYTYVGDVPLFKMDISFQKELLTFILKVYYLLIQYNPELLCLLMNIKPKIFIGLFITADDALFDFLERVNEMLYTTTYKFDNYYFFSECLCFIVNYVMEYFMHRERTVEKDVKNLTYIGKVMQLAVNAVNNISTQQNDFVNVIDSIQRFICYVKDTFAMKNVREMLSGYFVDKKMTLLNMSDNNNNANYSNEIVDVLIKYFNYMSELISNDFKFFSATNFDGVYLFDVDKVLEKEIQRIININTNTNNLIINTTKRRPIELEYAMLNYYFKANISFKFTVDNISNQILRIFKPISTPTNIPNTLNVDDNNNNNTNQNNKNVPLFLLKGKTSLFNQQPTHNTFPFTHEDDNHILRDSSKPQTHHHPLTNNDFTKKETSISNASLINLSITCETPTNESIENKLREHITTYHKIASLLYKLTLLFPTTFTSFFENNQQQQQTSPFEQKLFFYKYFENILIRPIYSLVNLFILHSDIIKGSDCSLYQVLIFETLKSITYFYKTISTKDNTFTFNEVISKHFNEYENKSEIFEYENITLNKEITNADIVDIYEDMKYIKEKTKFYHIDILFSILIKNIDKIIYMKPKRIESIKTATSIKSKKQPKVPFYKERLNKLIKKYHRKTKQTYDTELSLFSALQASEKEMDQEIGKELLLYLLYKLSDTLTDENYSKMIDVYKKGTISGINVKNFRLQNSYVLTFLNALFYNYSENFQNYLSEAIGEHFFTMFEFFVTGIIYPCNINEVTKMYVLDRIRDFNHENGEKKQSLSEEICCLSIKLLQNMCESHNRVFQNRFFNYIFDMSKYKYTIDNSNIDNVPPIGADDISNSKDNEQQKENVEGKKGFNIFGFAKKKKQDEITGSFFSKIKTAQIAKTEDIGQQGVGIKTNTDNNNINIGGSNIFLEKVGRNLALATENKLAQSVDNASSTLHKKVKSSRAEGEKRLENENRQYLLDIRYSFFNFIIHNMRLIIDNLQISNTKQNTMLNQLQTIKSVDYIINIYQYFSDLVVEMIQGTQEKNFNHFYIKLSEKYRLFDEEGNINYFTLPSFVFLQHCIEMNKIFFETENIFNEHLLPILLNMFIIIVNVISQEVTDTSLIQSLIIIFPPDKLLAVVSSYLRGLMINHIKGFEYDDPSFADEFDKFEFTNTSYIILKNYFKEHLEIYEDEFFKLAGQMYLLLINLGKRYHIAEAERVLRYDEKELVEHHSPTNALSTIVKSNKFEMLSDRMTLLNKSSTIGSSKAPIKHEINNHIIAAKFFNKIIKKCEFVIENGGDKNIKTIYFITDPRSYFISKNNIEKFFDEVDRSSSTTKLKSLIDVLNGFMYEVNFKYDAFKDAPYLKWMFAIDYKNVDFFNFCCALLINLLFVLFLDRNPNNTNFVRVITTLVAGLQIFVNIIYLTIFFISKYNFAVILAKSEYSGKKLSLIDYMKVYVFDSFLFNDEIYLMILVCLMGCIGIVSRYASFLFSLQLLTVVKFVATIKEIVLAFQLRIGQLISMVGFLIIFLYFYANLGFNFFKEEFNVDINENETANICSSLLECTLTYFNHGVRAGGGIGDLLGDKEFQTGMYWVRWFNDFLFFLAVILMLLNMINGVIVSTFSQIREERDAKEEDINNKCFICNIDRVVFERMKIQFKEHQKYEHNTKTYIRFLIYLKMLNEKDLDADQSFIINVIKNREIKCFPVNQSISTGVVDEDEEDEGEGKD